VDRVGADPHFHSSASIFKQLDAMHLA
jgi:hypothetical protein